MTLLMWRNHFTCDILAERGSAHIQSLCKWGPSMFTRRTRVLPSGRPPEEVDHAGAGRPDLGARIRAFQERCARAGAQTDLSNDIWLHRVLERLSGEAVGLRGGAMKPPHRRLRRHDPSRAGLGHGRGGARLRGRLLRRRRRADRAPQAAGLAGARARSRRARSARNGARQRFTSSRGDLGACDIVYVAPDVPTDDQRRERRLRLDRADPRGCAPR